MGPKPKTPDLMASCDDPAFARDFIAKYDWGTPDPPKYVVWGLEEKIWFDKMTDAEACYAAKKIIREVEIPMAVNTAQLEKWEH